MGVVLNNELVSHDYHISMFDDVRRNVEVKVRVTSYEKKALLKISDENGISISDLLRKALKMMIDSINDSKTK